MSCFTCYLLRLQFVKTHTWAHTHTEPVTLYKDLFLQAQWPTVSELIEGVKYANESMRRLTDTRCSFHHANVVQLNIFLLCLWISWSISHLTWCCACVWLTALLKGDFGFNTNWTNYSTGKEASPAHHLISQDWILIGPVVLTDCLMGI